MSLFTHGTNCIMHSSGAFLEITKLTEFMSCFLCFKWKDRYRMVLNSRDLFVIIVAGDILRFTGVFPLISPYCTTLA